MLTMILQALQLIVLAIIIYRQRGIDKAMDDIRDSLYELNDQLESLTE